MFRSQNRSVILDLKTIGGLFQVALRVSSANESAADVDCRGTIHDRLGTPGTDVLKSRFVYDPLTQGLCVADLQSVFGVQFVKTLAWQAELANTVVDFVFTEILVSRGKRVRGRKLVVDTRREVGAGARIRNCIGKLNRSEICIERRRVYHGDFIDVAAVEHRVVRRLVRLAFKGISGVQSGRIAVDHELAMQFVRTGFGENLDATVSKFVVFGRKGVLIQANFAN